MRRTLLVLFALAAVVAVAFYVLTMPRAIEVSALPTHSPDLANGKYMFTAGGCAECHAAPLKACDDRKTKNRKAKRCETEEAKAWHSVPLELAVDDKVGRGGHERHHAAYEGSEAERHHQPPRAYAGALRNAQHDGNENRGHRRRTHCGAQ